MAEMEKSWESKLKEAQEAAKKEEEKRKAEEKARLDGLPHLLNLNEDP